MNRTLWLERQMERDDLTDAEFAAYNRELNEIYSEREDTTKISKAKRAAELKQEQEELDLARAEAITDEEVEKMYVDSCTKYQDVNGVSFEQWYQQSLKYYSVDAKYTVHARARSSNTVEYIHHVSQAHAKLTILKRIKYKFYDHAVRNNDFAYDI
jgi:uncharacterized protein (DUF1697 family)